MPDAAWLPMLTAMVLGGACIAIARSFSALRRRTEHDPQPERASRHERAPRVTLAVTLFLVALAGVFFLDAATVAHPLPALATALRAIAAVAAVRAAFLLHTTRTARATPTTQTTHAAHTAAGSVAATEAPASEPPRSRDVTRSAGSDAPGTAPAVPPSPISATALDATPEIGFLGLVSHELRTPLTAMHLLLDRLLDAGDELPARHRRIVERLSSTAVRLTDLVDSMLYYARIKSGQLVTSVEPFDLSALATDAAEELRPLAERKALVLHADREPEHVSIESDPKLVRLVIVNLVSNAVKFTEQGEVAVSVSAEGDSRIVRVTDSGSGIALAEQKRIFEPFRNVEATKHKHLPGVGLGLSLARYIVDNLGGQIAVQSELGRGSTFEVSLPAVTRARTVPPGAFP